MSRLLAIDVGNTSTSLGWFDEKDKRKIPRPLRVASIPTPRVLSLLLRFAKKGMPSVVSSVVPAVDAPLRRALTKLTGRRPLFIRWNTPSRVRNRYGRPREVGSDRLVNARAGLALFTGPFIVIDFGTATTFDCVSSRREYLGGVIAPGPVISAEALFQRTAQLPRVHLKKSAKPLGRTTVQSIEAGLYWGYRGLIKEITTALKRAMGGRAGVLSTGGQAEFMIRGLAIVDRHEPHLTLIGLMLAWRDISRDG